jgi:hypothetical protein
VDIRSKVEKKVRDKEREVRELHEKLRKSEAYLQALSDTLALLPKETDRRAMATSSTVRRGAIPEAAAKALKARGKPIHIMKLLPLMGRKATTENRASVVSSLGAYVRRGQVFTRPAPNTFGLREWGVVSRKGEGPPVNFGLNH